MTADGVGSPRIALVTGGTSGIGYAIVRRLLQENMVVYAIGRTAEHADAVTKSSAEQGERRLRVYVGDIRDEVFCKCLVADISRSGMRLDVLVHAAGVIGCDGFSNEMREDWNRVIDTNLTAPVFLTQSAIPLLASGENPVVLFVSSICGIHPCDCVSYSASKAGIDAVCVSLARQLAYLGIRVNAIAPGLVPTNLYLSAGRFESQDAYESWVRERTNKYPLGRVGTPEDVASAAMFLCSKSASWITGAVLNVDGGRLTQR